MQITSNGNRLNYWTLKIPTTLLTMIQDLPEQLTFEAIVHAFGLLRAEIEVCGGLLNSNSFYGNLEFESLYDEACEILYNLTNYHFCVVKDRMRSSGHGVSDENAQEDLEKLVGDTCEQLVLFMGEFIFYFKSLYLPYNQPDNEPFKYSHASWLLDSHVYSIDLPSSIVIFVTNPTFNVNG